jgi:hypothetical protein
MAAAAAPGGWRQRRRRAGGGRCYVNDPDTMMVKSITIVLDQKIHHHRTDEPAGID